MLKKIIGAKLASVVLMALAMSLTACSRQQSDWQKTRQINTADAYEQFLKKYPQGEFSSQAQARVKELYEEGDWQKARDADTPEAYQAFLKEHPDGKWTEEARIRVENFTLAQAPGSNVAPGAGALSGSSSALDTNSAATAGAPVTPPTATPPTATPPPVSSPSQSLGSTPPVSSRAAAPAPAAAPAAAPRKAVKATPGSFGVQLGAFKSGAAAALERWSRLQKQYPTLLAGLSPKVSPKQSDEGKLYRLQVLGITENHARNLCNALKAKAQPCLILPPARI